MYGKMDEGMGEVMNADTCTISGVETASHAGHYPINLVNVQ